MSVNSHPVSGVDIRKRPVQDRSRRTVDAILNSAAHFFATNGYSATTTNHIAGRAGVSIGSLYQYFPNKDSLLVALEERHLEHAGLVFRATGTQWRRTEPEVNEWAASFVGMLIAVNDSEPDRVLYNTAPRSVAIAGQATRVVNELADEVAFHLRRWGRPSEAHLRVGSRSSRRLLPSTR